MDDWRKAILAEARSWLGTPYHHKGRVKGVGADCGGLLYEVYSTQFALEPFPDTYPMDWALHRGDEIYLAFIERYISETFQLLPADIIVFQYGRTYSHAGIFTERGGVIHAWGRQGFGSVRESPMRFFNSGGVLRPRKMYRVEKK